MRNKNMTTQNPLVSVIMPVFNGDEYIEETIKSIINQSYNDVEFIIIDGKSTDKTIDVIKKYDKYIDFWVSEPDKGQTDAINKGFNISKGDIFVWLNCDDIYFPNTIENVVKTLEYQNAKFTYGHCQLIDSKGNTFRTLYTCKQTLKSYQADNGNIFQGTVFFRKELWEKYGPLDIYLKCAFEYKLFDEFFKNEKGVFINKVLAQYRIHNDSISSNFKELFSRECATFRKKGESSALKKLLYGLRRNILNIKDGNLVNKITCI